MKYFIAKIKTLTGSVGEAIVDRHGDDMGGWDENEQGEVVLGVTVYEIDEQGETVARFYPVTTDTETSNNDLECVLDQIESDHPAGVWQNNEW